MSRKAKLEKQTELDKYAAAVRAALPVSKQDELFRVAVEGGYLVALADGEVDADERAVLGKTIEALSVGLVIDWEVDALIEKCTEEIGEHGHVKRCEHVGSELKKLDQAEAGLLIAAYVAMASGGIDKREATMLENIGKAAGIAKSAVGQIVKKARSGA